MKQLLAILIAVLLIPSTAFAAITFDTANAVESSGSVSATLASGDGIAIYYVWTNSSCTPTAVSFGGSGMTSFMTPLVSGTATLTGWYLINPLSGNSSASVTGCASFHGSAIAAYQGANAINASSTHAFTTGSTLTNSVTTVADNSWVVTGAQGYNGGTLTASTNVTGRGSAFSAQIGDNAAAVHPAGALSQTWSYNTTCTSGAPCLMGQVALTPSPPSNPQPPMLMTF